MTKRLISITAIVLVIAFAATIAYYYVPLFTPDMSGKIQEYNEARDFKPILELMEKDRYWLIASENYSIEYMLKNRTPSQEEKELHGKLAIKVLYEKGQFVGFVAYYLKNFFSGHVLFLAVTDAFRGKGYGKQLMDYALNELKKQGASMAYLVTRVSNKAAQAVYKKTGFTEAERDDNYVYFIKWL